MGRKNTIDRERVLAEAEKIVTDRGAGALTIEALADAAGITKGGVQSCFRTKEGLIEAMLTRWLNDHERRVAALSPAQPSPAQTVALHVRATGTDDDSSHRRMAGLLSGLLQFPDRLGPVRHWYQSKTEGLTDTSEDRSAHLAFLATEGAFFLRYLGLIDYTQGEWDAIFGDISTRLLDSPTTASSELQPAEPKRKRVKPRK